MFLMLHFEQWDFNGASLIGLGHRLTAYEAFKGMQGTDETDGPDLVMFTPRRHTLTLG